MLLFVNLLYTLFNSPTVESSPLSVTSVVFFPTFMNSFMIKMKSKCEWPVSRIQNPEMLSTKTQTSKNSVYRYSNCRNENFLQYIFKICQKRLKSSSKLSKIDSNSIFHDRYAAANAMHTDICNKL